MGSKTIHRKVVSPGLREKRARVQKLAREYNVIAREYNELSKRNWATAQKHTKTGEAAAKRLVKKYNQLAAKGRALERAATAYNNARKKKR